MSDEEFDITEVPIVREHREALWEQGRFPSPDPTSDKWFDRAPREAYIWALNSFLKGMSRKEIGEKAGIDIWRLDKWAAGTSVGTKSPYYRKGWNWLKARVESEAVKKAVRSRREKCEKLIDEAFYLLEKAFEDIKVLPKLSVKDAQNLTSILKDLDNMERLQRPGADSDEKGKLTRHEIFALIMNADAGILEQAKGVGNGNVIEHDGGEKEVYPPRITEPDEEEVGERGQGDI